MAEFMTNGLVDLSDFFDKLGIIPDDVQADMLNAEADIVEKAQLAQGKSMGVHRTGVTLTSIQKGKVFNPERGKAIKITFEGNNDADTRNAEVAFLNEYGVYRDGISHNRRKAVKGKEQPARPFIRLANEEAADPAVEAAAKIFGDWQDSL